MEASKDAVSRAGGLAAKQVVVKLYTFRQLLVRLLLLDGCLIFASACVAVRRNNILSLQIASLRSTLSARNILLPWSVTLQGARNQALFCYHSQILLVKLDLIEGIKRRILC